MDKKSVIGIIKRHIQLSQSIIQNIRQELKVPILHVPKTRTFLFWKYSHLIRGAADKRAKSDKFFIFINNSFVLFHFPPYEHLVNFLTRPFKKLFRSLYIFKDTGGNYGHR